MIEKNTHIIKVRTAYIILCCIVMLVTACSSNRERSKPNNTKESASFFAMDTVINITAYGEKAAEAEGIAKEKIQALEKKWSVTDNGSEIYQVNNRNQAVTLSEETAELVQFAIDMGKETNGALDISMYPIVSAWGFTTGEHRVPLREELDSLLQNVGYDRIILNGLNISMPDGMKIDLGSVGKGYAGDLIARDLKENGIASAILDLGGNIQTVGKKIDGSNWKVGIRNPFEGDTLATVEIGEKAVVTSGGYERYFEENGSIYWHILDPKTGEPAHSGLVSVTVIGNEGRLCDALSTAIFVMGLDSAKELWKNRGDFDFVVMTDDSEIFITEGIADVFSLMEAHSELKVNIIR